VLILIVLEIKLPALLDLRSKGDAYLFADGVANIQVDWQTESREIFQRKRQHEGNISFTGSIVSDVKAKRTNPATQVTMNCVRLLVNYSRLELVIFIKAEPPVVV
jgi:hypothetical protein